MKSKKAWLILVGMLILLGILAAACGIIEPPVPPPPVATISPPLIPHTIDGRDDCLACHGEGGILVPDNHGDRTNNVCLSCHDQSLPGETMAPSPEEPAGEEQPEEESAGLPPNIPHTLDGRDDCLLCHDTDAIVPYPTNHEGRSVDICTECHEPAATPVEEEPDEVVEEERESDLPPNIPHTLDGRDDCLMCHAEGGFVPFPADHAGRGNDICRACHQPS